MKSLNISEYSIRFFSSPLMVFRLFVCACFNCMLFILVIVSTFSQFQSLFCQVFRPFWCVSRHQFLPVVACPNERMILYFYNTVEPPISDCPKCQDSTLTGGGRLQESNQSGLFPGTGLAHLLIRRELIACVFLVTIRAVLGCHLKVLVNSV